MAVPVAFSRSVVGGTSAAFTSSQTCILTIDTLGYDHASIDVIGGPAASTSSVFQTLTLQQSDTEAGTYGNITGFTGDMRPAAYAAQTATSQMTVSRIEVDLRGRQRYLRVQASPNTTTVIVVAARLSKAEEGGYDATTKGVRLNTAG